MFIRIYKILLLPLITTLFTYPAISDKDKRLGANREIIELKDYYKNIVNIVQLDQGQYIFCDYNKLYLFNTKNKFFKQIPLSLKEYKGILTPTGLYFDSKIQRLYVANYTGGNILIFDWDKKTEVLELKSVIENEALKGPEGIYVSGDHIFVADYNAGKILCFTIKKNDYLLKWSSDVPNAHSVIKLGDFVYGTSLQNRQILKISMEGEIVKITGEVGNKPPHHLWPVHLFITHKNDIGVVDAHQGSVALYNHDLSFLSYFGQNGSRKTDYNFPYCMIAINEGYLLVDTFRNRFVQLDHEFNITAEVNYGNSITKNFSAPNSQKVFNAENYPPYVYEADDNRDLFKDLNLGVFLDLNNVFEGYNGFVVLNQENQIAKYLRIHSSKLADFIITNHVYITSCKKIKNQYGEFYIIFSPQLTTFIVIDPLTLSFTPIPNAKLFADSWYQDDLAKTMESLPDLFQKFVKLRELIQAGRPRFEAYNEIFFQNDSKTADEFWKKVFSQTDQGKAVYDGFRASTFANSLDEYVSYSKNSNELFIIEIIALTYLNGKPIF